MESGELGQRKSIWEVTQMSEFMRRGSRRDPTGVKIMPRGWCCSISREEILESLGNIVLKSVQCSWEVQDEDSTWLTLLDNQKATDDFRQEFQWSDRE